MKDSEILEMAKEAWGYDFHKNEASCKRFIAFAHLVQKKQIERDAGICQAYERNDGADTRFAAAILAQED